MLVFYVLCGFVLLLTVVVSPLVAAMTYITPQVGVGRDKASKIEIISLIVLAGFVCSLFYHCLATQPHPFNTFLANPAIRFGDFTDVMRWNQYLPLPPSSRLCYFPFSFAIINAFVAMPVNIALILFLVIFTGFFLLFSWRYLCDGSVSASLRNMIVLSFLTFPFLFALDRANFEVFVFMFLGLFIHFYQKNKTALSAVFLACAIAMKLFPAVFLVLFVADKKHKEAVLACVVAPALCFLSLLFFHGSISENIARLRLDQSLFIIDYIVKDAGLDFGHSLFGMLKAALQHAGAEGASVSAALLKPYAVFSVVFFALVSWHVIVREKKFWKKVMLLATAMNILPYASNDYKLIHLFFPLYLYINDNSEDKASPAYAVLFGLLLIPKNFRFLTPEVYAGVYLDPLLMLATICLIICEEWSVWKGMLPYIALIAIATGGFFTASATRYRKTLDTALHPARISLDITNTDIAVSPGLKKLRDNLATQNAPDINTRYTLLSVGTLYLDLDFYEKAEWYLGRALKAFSDAGDGNPYPDYTMGKFHEKRKHYDEAYRLYSSAVAKGGRANAAFAEGVGRMGPLASPAVKAVVAAKSEEKNKGAGESPAPAKTVGTNLRTAKLETGWYGFGESGGTWMSKVSETYVMTGPTGKVVISAYLPGNFPARKLTLSIPNGTYDIAPGNIRIEVQGLPHNKAIKLKLEVDKAVVPKAAGFGGDVRELGLLVRDMVFE